LFIKTREVGIRCALQVIIYDSEGTVLFVFAILSEIFLELSLHKSGALFVIVFLLYSAKGISKVKGPLIPTADPLSTIFLILPYGHWRTIFCIMKGAEAHWNEE